MGQDTKKPAPTASSKKRPGDVQVHKGPFPVYVPESMDKLRKENPLRLPPRKVNKTSHHGALGRNIGRKR